VGTPAGTNFSDTGLSAATSYSYRVRAHDAVPNHSGYSSTASATTQAAATISYAQGASANPAGAVSTVSATFSAAQTAGNLNVVAIGFSSSSLAVQSVTDSNGNTYTLAVGPTVNTASHAIYYAKNIYPAAAGVNSVTVTLTGAANYVDLRIAEYGGIDTVSPLDVVVAGTGTSSTANSGSVATTHPNDLIVAADYTGKRTTGPGAGYTQRVLSAEYNILQDRIVSATGSYNATAPLSQSTFWIMQLAAFKAASVGGGDTQAPTAPAGLSATAASASQINLSWTASTDNVAVTGYFVERCQGSGCSNFSQVGTATGTTFSDMGLSPSTSYSYRVRAHDAVPNLSGYSGTASDTTQAPGGDTQAPTAPNGLIVVAASSNEIDIAWNASTDNVGVTAYLIERCEGPICSVWSQIATTADTKYFDTGRSASTSYSYRVRAQDAANNTSTYSNTLTYVTPASNPDCD
jgi:chitodextrinase